MTESAPNIYNSILTRIRAKGGGWCFTPADFADLGTGSVVWTTLHRLTRLKIIRRLARGLYDFPRTHPKLGLLSPDPDEVANALARSAACRIQPTGAYAANLLGLSEQVPARIVYLTDGSSRRVTIGAQEIRLKRTTPRNMATAGRISGIVVQALRFIGEKKVDPAHIRILRKRLSEKEKRALVKDRIHAPAWMRPIILEIARGTGSAR